MFVLVFHYPMQLQSYYDFLAQKFGAEISQIFCEGAAQNPVVQKGLPPSEATYLNIMESEVYFSIL